MEKLCGTHGINKSKTPANDVRTHFTSGAQLLVRPFLSAQYDQRNVGKLNSTWKDYVSSTNFRKHRRGWRMYRARSTANRRKTKSSLIGADGDIREPGGLETGGQRRRVNGNQCVRDMEQAHHPAVRAVHAGKHAAGAEDAADLLKEPVLELDGRNVMEHGEGHGAGKRIALERQGGAVAAHDAHVGAAHPKCQRVRKLAVNFNLGKLREPQAQPVRREAGAGTDFQQIVAKINAVDDCGKDRLFQHLLPS